MKVLMINSVCGVGSTGRICTDLYGELVKEGHECCIAFGRGEEQGQELYNNYRIGTKYDNYWHVLETRLLDNHGFASRNATKKFIDFIEDYRPDVIHIHNIHGYYVNMSILFDYLLNNKHNFKIIWTLHDSWSYLGNSAYTDEQGKESNKSYPKNYISRRKRNIKQKKNIFSGIKNMTIVTPSQWLADEASSTYLDQYPIKVIHNGIDLRAFQNSKKNTDSKFSKTKILGVANIWDDRKGLCYINELAKKYNEYYEITIVGNTQSNFIDKNIKKIDRLDSVEELATLYASADVFINPTLQDNFPTTNIEALACGTPVVTFDTGGSGESITPECGLVCSNKTVVELNRAIQQVIQDKNIDSKNCRNRAQEFDKVNMVKKYLNVYKKKD